MSNNIFMEDRSPISFEEYLQFNENGRGNLGDMLPVTVYRMLEYSIKEELVNNFGKEKQIEIFRKAGRKSGEFLSELQRKLEEFKIGVLRIESIEEKSGKIILTVSEDADCSGLPILGETVCNYDEGFISGILSVYTDRPYEAIEVDCWATGDRVCRFHANVIEDGEQTDET